jgi:hypothetical protein
LTIWKKIAPSSKFQTTTCINCLTSYHVGLYHRLGNAANDRRTYCSLSTPTFKYIVVAVKYLEEKTFANLSKKES